MCDRVAVIAEGVVQQVATPSEIYRRPSTRFVAGFVGLLNSLPTVSRGGRTELGGVEAPDGPCEIGFRPESARFAATGIPCTVERAVYRGAFTRYHLQVLGRAVTLDSNLPPGPCVELTDAWLLKDA